MENYMWKSEKGAHERKLSASYKRRSVKKSKEYKTFKMKVS